MAPIRRARRRSSVRYLPAVLQAQPGHQRGVHDVLGVAGCDMLIRHERTLGPAVLGVGALPDTIVRQAR